MTKYSGRVYICYRRTDTAPFAGRLYDHLTDSFGEDQVLMDVDSIQPGGDWIRAIQQAVTSCEVLLALIGSSWLAATDQKGRRRIDDPDDYVRLQIETALHNQLFVVPILAGEGGLLPLEEDLPTEIQGLAMRQAVVLTNEHFRSDAARLISLLENILRTRTKQMRGPQAFLVPRKHIFVSYSHRDQYWLDRLLVHLRPLERQGRLELWNDRQIRAGDEWRIEIRKAIQSCQAAVLLISADFMASDFIYSDELTPLLEAGKERGVRIIPLLVSSSYFEDSTLSKFQAVNGPTEPLDTLSKGQQEACLVNVYRAVRDALNRNT
jgi:TIR domain-containing protein